MKIFLAIMMTVGMVLNCFYTPEPLNVLLALPLGYAVGSIWANIYYD